MLNERAQVIERGEGRDALFSRYSRIQSKKGIRYPGILANTYTIQTDIPGLLKNPLRFMSIHTKEKEPQKKTKKEKR